MSAMKRIVPFVFFLFLLNFTAIAKTGVGVFAGGDFSFNIEPESNLTAGISLRSDLSPWGISASWNFSGKSAELALDNWWICKKISPSLNFYALWGMSFGGRFENEFYGQTGARLGFGFDAFLFKNRSLEFYAQSAWNPSIGMNYNSDGRKFSLRFVPACFPVNAGCRLWFGK